MKMVFYSLRSWLNDKIRQLLRRKSDDELDAILRKSALPERPRDYDKEFAARVMSEIRRRVLPRPPEPPATDMK